MKIIVNCSHYMVLYISLSGIAQPSHAQPKKIAFETYGVAEGLPEEYVVQMILDDKGFIWP